MRLKYTCVVVCLIGLCVYLRAMTGFGVKAESCPTPHSTEMSGPVNGKHFYAYFNGMAANTRQYMRYGFDVWSGYAQQCPQIHIQDMGDGAFPATQGADDIWCYTAENVPLPDIGPNHAGAINCDFDNPNDCGGFVRPIRCRIWLRYPSAQLNNMGNLFTTFPTACQKIATHEVGHLVGLGHQPIPYVPFYSIMNNMNGPNDAGVGGHLLTTEVLCLGIR